MTDVRNRQTFKLYDEVTDKNMPAAEQIYIKFTQFLDRYVRDDKNTTISATEYTNVHVVKDFIEVEILGFQEGDLTQLSDKLRYFFSDKATLNERRDENSISRHFAVLPILPINTKKNLNDRYKWLKVILIMVVIMLMVRWKITNTL